MAAVSQSLYGLEGERWENLSIQKSGGSYIFRSGFKTSRFAVASVDWPVPDNARLDDYYVETWLGEENPRRSSGSQSFKVSRYDLPNFVVNVKPDRGYYLPGQNAEIIVSADYLFDQPVKQGRGLDYLAKRSEAIYEPYLLASYALAAMDAGEKAGAEKAVAKLRTFAREDAGTSYWHPESNTPFYGWGLAGRIETTALAVKALCSE